MPRLDRRPLQGATLLVLVLLAACSQSPTSPGIQPEVVNLVDDFAYQVTGVRNYSGSVSYSWQNTGTTANVNQAATVTAGATTLVILDAVGTEVYARSLAENGTFATAAGAPGTWTIRLVYDRTSATLNFRAQKTT